MTTHMTHSNVATQSGYAPVNGLNIYYEIHGDDTGHR